MFRRSEEHTALLFTGAVSYAQVTFTVLSPESITGNYDHTYAPFGGDWGVGDLLDPLQAVEDTLMFVEDGSAGTNAQGHPISQEGCNPLINNLSGKIAVVYRNTCEFGSKAYNAQVAGARAVIIVNREDALINIGGGTDGINVTIPVIFVSSVTGDIFISKMLQGQTVTAFIGNKIGLFDNDLGMKETNILVPNPTTNHALLSLAQDENSQRLGGMIYNYGNNDQTNVMLKAEVMYNGAVVFSQEMLAAAAIPSGDSVQANLPDFTLATYPIGMYTLNYTVTSDATDESDNDNLFTTDFYISGSVFSYGKLNADGLPFNTNGSRPSGTASSFGGCTHFQDPNASRVELEGIYFSAVTNDPGVLLGQAMIIDIWSIDEDFVDINTATTITLTQVNSSEYIYTEELQDTTVYAPLSEIVTLEDNRRYLACVTTFDANTFIGTTDINFNWNVDTLNQPISPIIVDDALTLLGFGDVGFSIGMKLNPTSATPIITANGLTEVCEGDEITLYSSATSGNQWKKNGNNISGATGTSLIVTTAGTYTVVANGNTSDPVVTTVTPYPAVPTITASGITTFCEGFDVVLTSSAANNNRWSDNQTTDAITVTESGNYTVSVNNGVCVSTSDTLVVTVNPLPDVFIQSALQTICVGSSIDLTAVGAANYSWASGETSSVITVSPVALTTYTVVGVDANGCSNVDDITIEPVNTITISVSATDMSICEGQSATISASGALSYTWDNGLSAGANNVVTPTATTTYTATGVIGACVDDASITITVNTMPTVTATADVTDVCEGETVTLTANGASTYVWLDGIGTGASVSTAPTVSGLITVVGTDANSCSDSADVMINVTPLPVITFTDGPSFGICADAAAYTLGATPAGGTYSGTGVTGSVFNPSGLDILTYTLTYTVSVAGCTGSQDQMISVNDCAGIEESVSANMNVYPNPAVNDLTIKADNLNEYSTIQLRDQLGRTVATWNVTGNEMNVNISKFATGNYTLLVSGANGNMIHKVIIK